MTRVYVNTLSTEVIVTINGSEYYFPKSTSRADYSIANDAVILNCAPIGLKLVFPSSAYEFEIDNVLYLGLFVTLVDDFNKNIFEPHPGISPIPEGETTIRTNSALTGVYVPTNSIEVIGRRFLNVDFNISGLFADPGNVIAILQVSDDLSNAWRTLANIVSKGNLHADGAATPYEAGTVFRNMSAEIPAYEIPYTTNIYVNPIRVTFATGYGRYYRFQVRASVPSGIQGGAPATFPDLEITATLQ